MADQPLGELPVIISGDWSDLQDALTDAQNAAQAGGEQISAAFNDISAAGATESVQALGAAINETSSQVGTLDDAASELQGSLSDAASNAQDAADGVQSLGSAAQDAGSAVGEASGSLGDFSGSASDAGESASEAAEGGLADMAEQLTAIGEALVITEGLKEFGEEALNATATVQSVTVGLTALTGSAQQADEIIEQIKQLAATEPFAFPEIAPTVQKMVAMGVAAEQIPGVLQTIADTAAATTNSFQQVAQMFDRMTLSGTANARSLATLGISAQQLNQAMGDLGAGADATSKQITAAFAAIPTQAQRIQILEDALSKFSGTAAAEAQTIGGQWQIFQNNFEEVMVGIGEALAPVVGDILSFGKTVMGAVQEVIDAFSYVPQPVQDVVIAVGLLAAAAVPLTAGLGALAIGISAISGALPALTALFGASTVAEGEAATAATTMAAADHAAAIAATELAAAKRDGALAGTTLATAEGEAAAGATTMAGIFSGPVVLGIGALVIAATLAYGELQKIDQQMDALAHATPQQAQEINTLTVALQQYNQQMELAGKQQIKVPDWDPAKQSLDQYIDSLQKAADQMQKFGTNASLAALNLDSLKNGGSIILGIGQAAETGAKAYNDLVTSVQKHQKAVADDQAAIQLAQTALNNATAGTQQAATAAEVLSAAHVKLATDEKALATAVDGTTQKWNANKAAMDEAIKGPPSYAQAVADAASKIIASQQNVDGQLQIDMGVYAQLATSGNATEEQLAAASAKIATDVGKMGLAATDTQALWQKAFSAMGLSTDTLIQKMETDAAQFGTNSQQVQNDMNQLSYVFAGDTKAMSDAIAKFVGDSSGFVVATVNNKTALVQQGQAATDAAGATKAVSDQVTIAGTTATSAAGPVGTLGNTYGGLITVMLNGQPYVFQAAQGIQGVAGAAAPAANAIQAYGQAHLSAAEKTQQLAEASGTAKGAIIDLTNYVHSATQNQSDYATSIQTSTTSYAALQTQIAALSQELTQTGDPAIAAQIAKLEQLAQAAADAQAAFQDLSSAESTLTGGKAGAGTEISASALYGPGGSLFGPGMYGSNALAMALGPSLGNTTGSQQYANQLSAQVLQSEISAVGSTTTQGQALQAALDALTGSLGSTTSSTKALDHALVGGSLQPSLDMTTDSTTTLDDALTHVAGNIVHSAGTLDYSLSQSAEALAGAGPVYSESVQTFSNGVQQVTEMLNGAAVAVREVYGTTGLSNINGQGTAAANAAAAAPAPGTYATFQDAVNAGLNPNEIVGNPSSGYSQEAYTSFTASTPTPPPSTGGTPGVYSTVQAAVQAGLNPNELVGNPASGYSQEAYTAFTLGGNSAGGGFLNAAPYTAESGTAPNSGGMNVTLNISGMTPGNAQYVMNQAVTQLRLVAGQKVT